MKMTIPLNGRIDSDNAEDVEKKIFEILGDLVVSSIVFDAQDLEYISSAGLRVILKLKKQFPDVSIVNVSPAVYEILDMTGFTQMLTVEKAFRSVCVDGCEEIGRGANGILYRIDKDNVVKVYDESEDLADIQKERDVAKLALILGIPTAISYEVVKVGNCYGSVFELLETTSFSDILIENPEKMDWCVDESVSLLKMMHETEVPAGKLPDGTDKVMSYVECMEGHVPDGSYEKLKKLAEELPHVSNMIHGDFHTKNLMFHKGEVLLVDMETLSTGHPIIDLAAMFCAYVGFCELDHDQIIAFQGYDRKTARTFWEKSLRAYLCTDDENVIRDVEKKSSIIGYIRMLQFFIRHGWTEGDNKRQVDFWIKRLLEELPKVDSLLFDARVDEK